MVEQSKHSREEQDATIQAATENSQLKPFSGKTYLEIMKLREELDLKILEHPEVHGIGTRPRETKRKWYWELNISSSRKLTQEEQSEIRIVYGENIPIKFYVRQKPHLYADSGQALRLRSGQLKGNESYRTARMT